MQFELIGQTRVIEAIAGVEEVPKPLPPFMILVGPRGQGKHVLVNYLAELYEMEVLAFENNVDSARTCITMAQGLSKEKLFVFYDTDNMSISAKNALLKICEEPPKNAHIVMTLQNKDNMLRTILSRARTFELDPYIPSDIGKYCRHRLGITDKQELCDYRNFATNIQECNILYSIGISDLYDYAYKVYENILEVSTSNAFKIADSVCFSNTAEEGKFPVELLLRAFQNIVLDELKNTDEVKAGIEMMRCTQAALNKMKNAAVGKRGIFDMWLLDIRRYR